MLVLPITIILIFVLLYTMFHSGKWALLILVNVSLAPLGGLLALWLTGTNFSVSSGVGFLALFGVSSCSNTSTRCGFAVTRSKSPPSRELFFDFARS
jgi:Cu/Ag efflux pump CusA